MQTNMKRQIKCMTVSAMLCALGVVILGLGAIIEVIDLSVAVIASLLIVYAVIEMGGAYPWLIWIVTSIVSILLLPLKTPVLFYAMLAGFYPILKEKIEKRCNLPIGWVLKLGILVLSVGLIYAVSYFFLPSLLVGYNTLPYLLGFFALVLLCFVLYDVCLTRLITFYLVKLQKRLRLKQ